MCLAKVISSDGNPLARDADGTCRGAIMCFPKADLAKLVAYGRPSYGSGHEICGECLANRTDMPHTDIRHDATWRPSEVAMTNAQYVARYTNGHPMADSPFFNKFFHRLDAMHVLDHHGLSSVLMGSILRRLVVLEGRLGTNQQARLDAINAEFSQYYNDHLVSTRLPKLLLSNLVSHGWSELSGPLIKAAGVRNACPFVEVLARRYFDDGSDYSKAIVKCISYLNGVYDVLYSANVFLTDVELEALRTRLLSVGRYHMLCRHFAKERHELHFAVRPKAHFAQHLYMQCVLINSRFVQCYAEESLVGRVTKIARSSSNGKYLGKAQHTVLIKYLVFLAVLLEM